MQETRETFTKRISEMDGTDDFEVFSYQIVFFLFFFLMYCKYKSFWSFFLLSFDPEKIKIIKKPNP
jgi:hypothetical protein